MTEPQRRLPAFVYGESMVGPRGEFVWYCVPKNASRSLLRMLRPTGAATLFELAGRTGGRRYLQAQQGQPFSFAFARHPYRRVVSAWNSKIIRAPRTSDARAPLGWSGLEPGMTLDAFVAWLAESYTGEKADKHWRRQTDFLADEQGLCVDFVGRVEAFDEAMAVIAARVGPLGPKAHKNRSPDRSDPARLLSEAARETLYRLYRRDFELLGFEP